MNIAEYERMFDAEERQWWYVGMRSISNSLLGPALHPATGLRLLDAGCGTGQNLRELAGHGRAVGVDLSPEALSFCTRRGVTGVRGNLLQLPFPDACFDVVTSFDVLYHAWVKDDLAVVRELVRVLRPGGRAVIFVPNRLYPFETHGHYWRGEYHFGNTPLINYLPDPLRNRLAPHVRTYTAKGLRHLFLGQPVRVLYHTQIYPGYDNIAARNPELGRWVRRITYALENTPLTAFGLSHFLVVEKT